MRLRYGAGAGIAASVGKRGGKQLHCKKAACEMLCTTTGKVKESWRWQLLAANNEMGSSPAESVQLRYWQWWVFVASCCKKERAEEGRGKAGMLGWVRGGLACVCSCRKCQGLTQTVLRVLIFSALVSAKVVAGQKCLCCFKQILLPGEYLPCWCLEPDLPWLPPSTTWEKEKERNYSFQKIMRRSSETCFLFAAGISISPRYALKTIKNKVVFFPILFEFSISRQQTWKNTDR